MKKLSVLLALTLVLGLTGCGDKTLAPKESEEVMEPLQEEEKVLDLSDMNAVSVQLSDSEILADGEVVSEDPEADIYVANDIIFYQEGQDITYGAGSEKDAHSQIEADAHTVVHITKPGTYELSGSMAAGQIFVDLGEEAEEDPEAVVNLILNNADITCTVAPAIFFYRVYECAENTEPEDASMDVDTAAAGANLYLADGSKNKVYGSYVAKIYKSCELNEEGTEVVEAKKLHKYDGAVYSKMSMNVFGNTGELAITAENEGLDTEMHLTIEGGNISIYAGNDGINVNEDEVSVFTMNDGKLYIEVTGETGEGDGIDSNGWLVINGGTICTYACAMSGDSGVDADMGIYVNGGELVSTGNMEAEIEEGKQLSIAFFNRERMEGGKTYEIKDSEGNVILKVTPVNQFSILTVSVREFTEDESYTLWLDDTQLAEGSKAQRMGGGMRPGGEMPEGMEPPEGFEGGERPEMPEGMEMPEGFDGKEPPEMPNGEKPNGEKAPKKTN